MKKISLTLLITLFASLPCFADADTYADSLIKKFCPGPGNTLYNSERCINAHNVKINIQILKELKELRKDIEDIKSQAKD